MTGWRASLSGRKTSARRTTPSSISIPTSQSIRTSGDPEQAALVVVQTLDAVRCHRDQLAGLDARALVGRHDVRLDHDRHALLEREVGDLLERPGLVSEHRRQVAADETVNEVVPGGEAGVPDDGGGLDQIARRGAGADAVEQGVERGVRDLVQLAIERRRVVRDRERPQELTRVVPVRGADLTAHDVAALELPRRRPLGGDVRAEVVDVCRAAAADVGALGQVSELPLVGAGPGLLMYGAHGVIREAAADPQPIELLARLP